MRSIVDPRTREAQGLPYYLGTPHSAETRVSRMFRRISGKPEGVRNGNGITCPSSSHPVDSNIAWFFQSRFQPFVGRVVSQLKIHKKSSTTVAPVQILGEELQFLEILPTPGKIPIRVADQPWRRLFKPQQISAADPVNSPRNSGFVFHSDTCNEMFIFFPFLVGDGNHWRASCVNSPLGRRETFSLERVAVAQPHLAPLRTP